MKSYEYVCEGGGIGYSYLPKNLRITILWLGDCYALTGDEYGITNRTWKTLKGAQNYMAREYPNYKLVREF